MGLTPFVERPIWFPLKLGQPRREGGAGELQKDEGRFIVSKGHDGETAISRINRKMLTAPSVWHQIFFLHLHLSL